MEKYTTVSLPHEFHRSLTRFIKKNPHLGYGSVAEFAKEAIRLRLMDAKNEATVISLRRLRDMPYINWNEKWNSFRDVARKKL
ncbi:MAG TPA: hypothetical protein ENL18_02255 [Thermoplasmatales archaeon]|nr:hypothetical protein [Thermoplasmatales archaeon]